jgi:putative nucleotide binding protein
LKEHTKEEYAVVLDFLPNGYPLDDRPSYKKSPVAQAIGKQKFTLLEIVPKAGVFLQPNEEIYIGEGKRDKVHHIAGKLEHSKLTGTGKNTLKLVIKNIVETNQKLFVGFFNNAQPLTMRMHSLELLPGLGKKHMWEIIDEREVEEFKDFADLKKRVKLMPDPEKAIIKRILQELQGNQKHYLFVDN